MKVVLLGLSGTGKSTIGNELVESFSFPVIEADEEVLKKYNMIWPSTEALIDKSFEETNKQILHLENVFYITSWLEKEMIKAFSNAHFQLILLYASFDELLKRRKQRDGKLEAAMYARISLNYNEFLNITMSPKINSLFSLTIDMTETSTKEAKREDSFIGARIK